MCGFYIDTSFIPQLKSYSFLPISFPKLNMYETFKVLYFIRFD